MNTCEMLRAELRLSCYFSTNTSDWTVSVAYYVVAVLTDRVR